MGDNNQWEKAKALEDFPDLFECPMGNTRGSNSIDKIITNLFPNMSQCGTIPPLEPDLPGGGLSERSSNKLLEMSDTKGPKI